MTAACEGAMVGLSCRIPEAALCMGRVRVTSRPGGARCWLGAGLPAGVMRGKQEQWGWRERG